MTVVHPEPVEAKVGVTTCPVHGSVVRYDGQGGLLGLCDGCAVEVAKGLVWLKRHPIRRKR